MKKCLAVLMTAILLLVGACASMALAEEEPSLLGAFTALSSMESQMTPEQEQELTSVVQYLTRDLAEETALAEIISWDKDAILAKLEGYETPLEHFASKEEAADLLAGILGTIAPLFQMSEEQLQEQVGGLMGAMGGLMDFSAEEEEDPYIGIGIDNEFNGTYWEKDGMKLTAVWQDGYYKILIEDGKQEWIYLCEEDQETGRKFGIGTGDPEQTETQEDHGIATFYTQYETSKGEMVWEKTDGSKEIFTRIIDPLDGTMWYREGMMLTLTWWGENRYGLNIDGYGLPEYCVWNYECTLDEEKDALEGTGSKSVFMGDAYTDAHAVFAFSEGRTGLTWTDDREEAAKEGLAFEAVDKALTNEVWEVPEKYSVSGIFGAGYYSMTVVDYGTEPTKEYQYLCTYDRSSSTLTAVDPAEIDYETIGNYLYLDPENLAGNATFEMTDDGHMVWKEATGVTGEEGITLTLIP